MEHLRNLKSKCEKKDSVSEKDWELAQDYFKLLGCISPFSDHFKEELDAFKEIKGAHSKGYFGYW